MLLVEVEQDSLADDAQRRSVLDKGGDGLDRLQVGGDYVDVDPGVCSVPARSDAQGDAGRHPGAG